MIENTAKVGGISVDAANKKRLSNRRIAVAISLIVSMFCAFVVGYNMYQANELKSSDSEILQKEIISVLDNNDCKFSRCREIVAEMTGKRPASAAESLNGFEEYIFFNVLYAKESGEIWEDRRMKLVIQKTTDKKLTSTVVAYY